MLSTPENVAGTFFLSSTTRKHEMAGCWRAQCMARHHSAAQNDSYNDPKFLCRTKGAVDPFESYHVGPQ